MLMRRPSRRLNWPTLTGKVAGTPHIATATAPSVLVGTRLNFLYARTLLAAAQRHHCVASVESAATVPKSSVTGSLSSALAPQDQAPQRVCASADMTMSRHSTAPATRGCDD
jgi:hypothetical protein